MMNPGTNARTLEGTFRANRSANCVSNKRFPVRSGLHLVALAGTPRDGASDILGQVVRQIPLPIR
jgi:hypothetical protein